MTSERTQGWQDWIVRRLIHWAAHRAPDSLEERLEEEWLADLAEQRRPLSRLRFAFGCCWAIHVIGREHGGAALPAASSPMGHGHFARYPREDFPFFTGRTITLIFVASVHVAVLYGLAMGLGPKFSKVIASPFVTRIIEPPAHSSLPPPLAVLPPSGPIPVTRVQGGPGSGFPSTNDFYPDASIRMGEKGVATVRTCVDSKGRLIADPTILQSTGSTRLDEGALRLAKAGSGHYRATMEDGRAVNSCYPFRIRFELRN